MSSRSVAAFAVAHTDISAQPFNNAQRTVRVLVPNNLPGTGLWLHFCSDYAEKPVWVEDATVAIADEKGRLMPGTVRPVKVHGDTSFALCPHRAAVSDFVRLPVQPGQTIAVSLYYPGDDKVTSGNFVSTFAQRSVKGNFTHAAALPKARLWSDLATTVLPWDLSSAVTTLRAVCVQQPAAWPAPRVVAAFGDSIMQQGAWVTPFTLRLYERFPGEVSVCNLGIGGNRLLHDSPAAVRGFYGRAGIERYRRDLLQIDGLTHVLFALGTNDIGLPGKDGAPETDLITPEQYARAVTQIASELRARGVKVFAGKMLPRELNHVYTPEREALRAELNRWLESCPLFDAVLDLGAPIADESGVGMKKEFALPDGLHPNRAGGKCIADAIDLELFA